MTSLTKADFEALAGFRFGLRKVLRLSEEAARAQGVTPQQYQLLLALKGFPDRDWATVGELADQLQLRHHTVVELINRVQKLGLVQRGRHPADWRAVRVELLPAGEQVLERLDGAHREQLVHLRELDQGAGSRSRARAGTATTSSASSPNNVT